MREILLLREDFEHLDDVLVLQLVHQHNLAQRKILEALLSAEDHLLLQLLDRDGAAA